LTAAFPGARAVIPNVYQFGPAAVAADAPE